ncbi:MAG TPA: M57 family metalloprotease [Longimicrobiaceae bacterium]|nr:M57 family metalloprotease [Longimicrobiaceae bacterium]
MIERLVARGFDRARIRDEGDHFVIEGDMVVYKSTLAELDAAAHRPAAHAGPGGPSFQWNSGGFPNIHQDFPWYGLRTLSVNLKALGSYPTQASALRQAFQNWNAIAGSGIAFQETTGTGDITVSTYTETCGSGCVLAKAEVGLDSRFGRTMTVNRAAISAISSSSQWITAMTHELGHTIAFMHTDWQGANESQCFWSGVNRYCAQQIAGTPATDVGSVMNHTAGPWVGFSYYDRAATRWMYPGISPTPTASVSGTTATLQWAPQQDAVSYKIYRTDPYFDSSWLQWRYTTTYVGQTSSAFFVVATTDPTLPRCQHMDGIPDPTYVVVTAFPSATRESPAGEVHEGGGACFDVP